MKLVLLSIASVLLVVNAQQCDDLLVPSNKADCILDENNYVQCITDYDQYGLKSSAPTDVQFSKIFGLQSHYACGIRMEDKMIQCWGENWPKGTKNLSPEEGVYIDACNYGAYACALREDHSLYCWGYNNQKQQSVPEGKFTSVACGYKHPCAIREDKTVACWAKKLDKYYEKTLTEVPEGVKFDLISMGVMHACGITEDQDLVCWGHDSYQQLTNKPEGKFLTVSAGVLGGCAISADDNTLKCWGRDDERNPFVSNAPEGEFKGVHLAMHDACAVRTDGTYFCWGNNQKDQHTLLANSGVKLASCGSGGNKCADEEAMIETLNAQVEEKDAMIETLTSQVEEKGTMIDTLTSELELWKSRFEEVETQEDVIYQNRLSKMARNKYPSEDVAVGNGSNIGSEFSNLMTFTFYIGLIVTIFAVGNYFGKKALNKSSSSYRSLIELEEAQ